MATSWIVGAVDVLKYGPHRFPDRNREDQRRGALRPPQSNPRSDRRRSPGQQDRRTATLELHHVKMIQRAAQTALTIYCTSYLLIMHPNPVPYLSLPILWIKQKCYRF